MKGSIGPTGRSPRKVRLPRSIALVVTPVVFLLGHVVFPQALSELSVHHGWTGGRPGWLNLLGIPLIAAGGAGIAWCLRLHFASSGGSSFETGATQDYLVVHGPYRVTRNPVYLSGMVIWLGWVVVYGSVAVLIGFVVLWGSVALLVVPWEERQLEARFGDAYLRYKSRVPTVVKQPPEAVEGQSACAQLRATGKSRHRTEEERGALCQAVAW
jgi:protein-S-isoprenylcysteine O-methyltransferase Ste14